ncbi:hypothetical protein M413DRAFT_151575 [Hebeloma cylindrosporum]|uniref:Uncharacterized protein n=1 Tax=Hebeloma cylindrosporum TaxID=76867 RepID=A0A0C3CDD0_HEBCY|nr:hypothetical protein M413DRAFT_151575 [Hebeloma cylindrosporum h7]
MSQRKRVVATNGKNFNKNDRNFQISTLDIADPTVWRTNIRHFPCVPHSQGFFNCFRLKCSARWSPPQHQLKSPLFAQFDHRRLSVFFFTFSFLQKIGRSVQNTFCLKPDVWVFHIATAGLPAAPKGSNQSDLLNFTKADGISLGGRFPLS